MEPKSILLVFPQQLIPYVEEDSSKHEERSASQVRPATEERREVLEVNKVRGLLGFTYHTNKRLYITLSPILSLSLCLSLSLVPALSHTNSQQS